MDLVETAIKSGHRTSENGTGGYWVDQFYKYPYFVWGRSLGYFFLCFEGPKQQYSVSEMKKTINSTS